MFFTQEDYKKIQQWLIKNSVKDTEFNEANTPFNGNEIVSIVQGNQNKKVFLKDLIAQIFNLGVSDFVNITDKYDAPNISLEEAIRLIPSRARKEGQVITFLDREDHWHIYQFKGVLNQWNVLDQWEDLFDWEKLIINSILPDEEDLTKSLPDANGNSYLSLKDREYNPKDFSGLGRVILRKNIVEIEDPTYGKVKKNVLYQDMINKENTIYEIRYEFDLNGATITIPQGCILQFDGGKLKNGTLIGQNTKLKYTETIFYNIEIQGEWVVPKIYSYLYDDIENDNLYNLLALQNEKIYNYIYIDGNNEYIVTPRNLTGLIINSNCTIEINANIRLNITDNSRTSFILQTWKPNIGIDNIIKNVHIKGSGTLIGNFNKDMNNYNSSSCGLRLFYCENAIVEGIKIKDTQGDSVIVSIGCDNIIINNVHVSNYARNGYAIIGGRQVILSNCVAKDGGYTDPYAAIDVEPNASTDLYTYIENNVLIENFTAINCGRALCSYHPDTSYIHSIIFKNIYIENCGIARTDILTSQSYKGDVFSMTVKDTNVSIENIRIIGGESKLGSIINAKNLTITNSFIETPLLSGLSLSNSQKVTLINVHIECSDYIFMAGTKNVSAINCNFTARNLFQTNNTNPTLYTDNILIEKCIINSRIIGVYTNSIFKNNKITIDNALGKWDSLLGYDTVITVEVPPIYSNNLIQYTGEQDIISAIQIGINNTSFINNTLLLQNTTRGIDIKGVDNAYIIDNNIQGATYKIWNSSKAVSADYSYLKTSTRPNFSSNDIQSEGCIIYDKSIKQPILWNGTKWVNMLGDSLDIVSQGTFNNKPVNVNIGYVYFCTDKQTPEGSRDGIMIYYAGNNTWVDALGRVVS